VLLHMMAGSKEDAETVGGRAHAAEEGGPRHFRYCRARVIAGRHPAEAIAHKTAGSGTRQARRRGCEATVFVSDGHSLTGNRYAADAPRRGVPSRL
jgi:hypothetical protein